MPCFSTREAQLNGGIGDRNRGGHRAGASLRGSGIGARIDDEAISLEVCGRELEQQGAPGGNLVAGAERARVADAGAGAPAIGRQMAEEEYRTRMQRDVLIRRVAGIVADLSGKLERWNVGKKHSDDDPPSNLPTFQPSRHQSVSLKSRPVISRGGSIPSSCKIVGPTSRSEPPARKAPSRCGAPAPTMTRGTGFVVCAVCGPPVAGSIISSQLP